MNYGFIKVCAATPEIRVADVEFNRDKIIEAIRTSSKNGSRLTVFPELCVCGYTCGDLFNQISLIKACEAALVEIAKSTSGNKTLVFVGAPIANSGKLYNCAVAIYNGEILAAIPKTFLPNYNEFYEKRYFSTLDSSDLTVAIGDVEVPLDNRVIFRCANKSAFTVCAEICEDLWAPCSPSINHTQIGANIVVNLSCSDELVGKADYRRNLVKVQSGKLICGYVYCDAGEGESSTDMTFSGHNLICENGNILSESKLFENGLLYAEIDVEMLESERARLASGYYSAGADNDYLECYFDTFEEQVELSRTFSKTPFIADNANDDRCELILTIQSTGLKKRYLHTGVKTAVLGVSGGLDSALALLVTCRTFKALGKDLKDIVAVSMPGFGTTKKTKNSALKLIQALGVASKTIPVTDCVKRHFKDIGHDEADKNVTYENAQARMRTLVLMDLANDLNGLVIGTGDLSELALGWATYNGDHMSMYGVNCSVPKTLVRHLIAYEAEKLGGDVKKILTDILNTEISPELLPPDSKGNISQKTEDLVGPYILHDFFIYYAIRYGFAPDKVRYLALKTFSDMFDEKIIDKWLESFYKRFFSQQFKRSALPDGVKIGSVCLSPRADWRMPSDAVSSAFLNNFKKI